MMKREFEELAGYEVSMEDYTNIIEPMYMATSLNKQEFVKCIDRKRFALKTEKQLRNEIVKEARHLMETAERYTDFDSQHRIEELRKEYTRRFYGAYDSYFVNDYTGTWFWGCEGRGGSFPVLLVIFDFKRNREVREIEILNYEKEMKRMAKEAC